MIGQRKLKYSYLDTLRQQYQIEEEEGQRR